MEVVVDLLRAAHRNGLQVLECRGENQLTIPLDQGVIMPDATLALRLPDAQIHRYYIELDRSTVTLQSARSTCTTQDRMLLYDRLRATSDERFMTLFVTRSRERRDHTLAPSPTRVGRWRGL